MILISIRAKTQWHGDTQQRETTGKVASYSINLNQMIFYVQYEHMMEISGLIGSPPEFLGLGRPPSSEEVAGFAEPPRYETCQKISQMAGLF